MDSISKTPRINTTNPNPDYKPPIGDYISKSKKE